MKIQRFQRSIAAILLVFSVLVLQCTEAGFIITVKADGTDKTITGLGTGTIANPSIGNWNKVYFGSKEDPILFNVLQVNETHFGGNTMLLDCASILEYQKFDKDQKPNEGAKKANEWAHSDVRGWLNDAFKSGRFTTAEISAIAESRKTAKVNGYDGDGWSGVLGWANLDGEQIFLLDAVEATNTHYGFENTYMSSSTRTKNHLITMRASDG